MTKVLEGRIAIITGAGGGIGRGVALAFADAGARLVLSDRSIGRLDETAALCMQAGAQVKVVGADVTSEDEVNTIVRAAEVAFGGVDILLNNAGLLTSANIEDLSTAMWDHMIDVDLRSVYLATRAVLPHMRRQRWGRVINIASQLALKGGEALSHYCAAKAGVIGFTKAVALEVARENVLVNAIAPGPIETPLLAGVSDEWKSAKIAALPLGRFGRVDEVAPTAVLLASDPGGNLYVGQTLGPNSGDVMP